MNNRIVARKDLSFVLFQTTHPDGLAEIPTADLIEFMHRGFPPGFEYKRIQLVAYANHIEKLVTSCPDS